jgi:hypothetical protein
MITSPYPIGEPTAEAERRLDMMISGKDYGVEVIRAYEFKRVGQVIYPASLMRDRLVRCGFVRRRTERDEPQAAVIETAALSVNHKKPKLRLK